MKHAAAVRTTFPPSTDDPRRLARLRRMDRNGPVREAQSSSKVFRSNVRVARTLWGQLSKIVTILAAYES